jgi:hypothetical protein
VRFPKSVEIRYARIVVGNQDDENYLYFSGSEKVNGTLTKKIDVALKLKAPFRVLTYSKERPKVIHLHNHEAETLLTLLATNPKKITMEWHPHNNSQLIEEAGLTQETLIIRSEKHAVEVNNVYKVSSQSMAWGGFGAYPSYEDCDCLELVGGVGDENTR